jgi:hypothetical protein
MPSFLSHLNTQSKQRIAKEKQSEMKRKAFPAYQLTMAEKRRRSGAQIRKHAFQRCRAEVKVSGRKSAAD